jgi:hypothetical protein
MQLERPLEDIFRTSLPARDKFLSRLFGLFSEEVVRHWAAQPAARYEDLGRPSLFSEGTYRHTLDFTLRDRGSGRVFISELKCELEFENYRYLRLQDVAQLRTEKRPAAFQAFVEMARRPTAYAVKAGGRWLPVDGAVLVWGATTAEGRKAVIAATGLADVLSIEDMVRDLRDWGATTWTGRIDELRTWTAALFDWLASSP